MTHIAFVTLFLGLTLGERTVELNVTGPAHHVELRLDDRLVAVMGKRPWRIGLDFGEQLVPHRLVARALDEKGEELARAEQVINVPRSSAEVNLLLDRDGAGKPQSVQVLWQSLEADNPKQVTLSLDGKNVPLDEVFRAKLGDIDTAVPHLMHARAVSPSGVIAETEVAFGGGLETSSGRQLTAVPVQLRDPKAAISIAQMESWLSIGAKPAKVVAIEEGPADIVIVRHPQANESRLFLDPTGRSYKQPVRVDEKRGAVRSPKPQAHFVWPSPMRMATRTPTDLMPVSDPFEFTSADELKAIVAHIAFSAQNPNLRYADAVAVAAIRAMDSRRPRAVILLVGEGMRDNSEMTPGQVRQYLRSIGVPLFVWSFGTPVGLVAWGDVRDVTSPVNFSRAFDDLKKTLQNQRIVWVDGEHFPAEVIVSAEGAKTIEALATR